MLSDLHYRIRALLHRDRMETDLQEELQDHVEREAEKHRAAGMAADEAMRLAKMTLGGIDQVRQQTREARGLQWMEDVLQDLRYGLRVLAKNPAFAIVTALTLALGVGACTAIFSVVNAVLIRSLPYGNAERLVNVFTPNPHMGDVPAEAWGPSYADFFDLQRQMHSFATMAAFEPASYSSVTEQKAVRLGAARVDGWFFSTLQSSPELGRVIDVADDAPGRHVMVISHGLWQSMFGGRRDVLGKSLRLNGVSYEVIGVMPTAFAYPQETDFPPGVLGKIGQTDLWIPLALSPQHKADRDNFTANVIARLRPGVTVREAQSEMSALMLSLDLLHVGSMRGFGAYVKVFRDSAVGPVRRLMWLLLGSVSLVLLISCGNAANLLLARAAARTHELGVRATLGAARGRIVRQMLTESLLLGLGGGCIGIALAYVCLRGLLLLSPGNIPRLEEATIDGRVLCFAFATAVVTSVAAGILPALLASRVNLLVYLKGAGSRGALGNHLRSGLIVGQVALVVILLGGAGLLLRSYVKVEGVQTGFSAATVSMDVQVDAKYRTREQITAFYRELLEKVQQIPGGSAAGLTNALPLSHSENVSGFFVEGYANQKEQLVSDRYVTPRYFEAMDIPVVAGRAFDDGDAEKRPLVVMINEAFAKRYFGGRNPVGLRMKTSGPDNPWRTVVGIVHSVQEKSLEAAPTPEVYEPLLQTANDTDGEVSLVVRSVLSSDQVIAFARAALRAVDPDLAFGNVQTMGALVTQATAERRFQTTLLTVFAAMAMLLGIVGIYGLLAYSVRQRTAEIGLRMALGASRMDVVAAVLIEGLRMAVQGLCIGIAVCLAMGRVLAASLYGVSAHDPVTLTTVPALLLVFTVVACVVPAYRAARVDPGSALRYE